MSTSHHHHHNAAADAEEKQIAKEMSPFMIYAAIPIVLIVIIALVFGPSY